MAVLPLKEAVKSPASCNGEGFREGIKSAQNLIFYLSLTAMQSIPSETTKQEYQRDWQDLQDLQDEQDEDGEGRRGINLKRQFVERGGFEQRTPISILYILPIL